MEPFCEVGFILFSNVPSLSFVCDRKKSSPFSFLSRPLFSPRGVTSDFEIKEFYLTSESMLPVSFITKPIMCTFCFLNPISDAQGSQGWSEKEGTFVCCFVLCVPFEAFNTMAFTHYHQRCGGGPEHRHPLQGEKTTELRILLISVNAKCILSGDLRFHIIMHQKIRSYFSSQKESLIATVTYCSCVANQTAYKKSIATFFCKGGTNCDHCGST